MSDPNLPKPAGGRWVLVTVAIVALLSQFYPSNNAVNDMQRDATQIPGQVVNGAGEVANEVGRATNEAIFGQSTPPSQPNSQ
jgi:hypothetical protein